MDGYRNKVGGVEPGIAFGKSIGRIGKIPFLKQVYPRQVFWKSIGRKNYPTELQLTVVE